MYIHKHICTYSTLHEAGAHIRFELQPRQLALHGALLFRSTYGQYTKSHSFNLSTPDNHDLISAFSNMAHGRS